MQERRVGHENRAWWGEVGGGVIPSGADDDDDEEGEEKGGGVITRGREGGHCPRRLLGH